MLLQENNQLDNVTIVNEKESILDESVNINNAFARKNAFKTLNHIYIKKYMYFYVLTIEMCFS